MPAVKFSRAAIRDLERVVAFLEEKNPSAALDAADKISDMVGMLEKFPEAGRLIRENPAIRFVATGFGKSGYVLRYRIDCDKQLPHLIPKVSHISETRTEIRRSLPTNRDIILRFAPLHRKLAKMYPQNGCAECPNNCDHTQS